MGHYREKIQTSFSHRTKVYLPRYNDITQAIRYDVHGDCKHELEATPLSTGRLIRTLCVEVAGKRTGQHRDLCASGDIDGMSSLKTDYLAFQRKLLLVRSSIIDISPLVSVEYAFREMTAGREELPTTMCRSFARQHINGQGYPSS